MCSLREIDETELKHLEEQRLGTMEHTSVM